MKERSRPGQGGSQTAGTDVIVTVPRRTHRLGCPMGCGGYHEPPCTVGRPLPSDLADWRDIAGVWLGQVPELVNLRDERGAA